MCCEYNLSTRLRGNGFSQYLDDFLQAIRMEPVFWFFDKKELSRLAEMSQSQES